MSAIGMLSNVVWGTLGDRRGHKLVMESSTLLWGGALLLALVAPSV